MSFAELAAGSTLAQGCWLVVSRGPCLPGREVGTPPQVVGHPFWKRGLCSFWCTARSAILRDILCPEEWAASLASVPARHQQHPPHVPWGTSVGFQTPVSGASAGEWKGLRCHPRDTCWLLPWLPSLPLRVALQLPWGLPSGEATGSRVAGLSPGPCGCWCPMG